MNPLNALELDFQAYVQQRESGMPARVVGTARADALQRLGIYADAYRLRLTEVLGNDYAALRRLAGEQRFTALATDYIAAHPSGHFNARWFGAALAGFLGAQAPWAAEPALAEMALLEWTLTEVFDPADEAVCGVEAAAAVAPELWGDMRVVPIAAQRRLVLHWNVGLIRQQADRNGELPAAQRLPRAETWLLWRQNYEVYFRALSDDEAAALAAVHEGRSFGQICEMLGDGAALRAAGLLRRWLDEGLVGALRAG